MMLFNIKQCRWRSVARQELVVGVVAEHRGQTPNVAAGVRTHIENNVFEF